MADTLQLTHHFNPTEFPLTRLLHLLFHKPKGLVPPKTTGPRDWIFLVFLACFRDIKPRPLQAFLKMFLAHKP